MTLEEIRLLLLGEIQVLNMYKILLLIIFLSLPLMSMAQVSNYLYKRDQHASAEAFVNQYFPLDDYTYVHDVIEGNWGDESKGEKIIAIIDAPIINQYDRITLLVFQPVGDGESYILIPYNEIPGVGLYLTNIRSVFFYDLDDDGFKELFILKHGEARVEVEIESEDENGEFTRHKTTGCCEDIYETTILRQKIGYENNFLGIIEDTNYESKSLDLSGLETAAAVKDKIENFKKE